MYDTIHIKGYEAVPHSVSHFTDGKQQRSTILGNLGQSCQTITFMV